MPTADQMDRTPSAPPEATPPVQLAHVSDETRELVERLLAEEKATWAYEIHDGLTQTVTAAVIELESMREMIERDPSAAAERLTDVTAQMRRALEKVREVIFELSDGEEDFGIEDALEEARERWGLTVSVDVEGNLTGLSEETSQLACLVIREGLANVAKHAGVTEAEVLLSVTPGDLEVRIRDHGRGLPPAGRDRHHFGMRMMRRRIEDHGGTLGFRSPVEGGTQVTAHIPIGGS